MALHILRKPWQFRKVYQDGKKVDCKYAVLFYYRTAELGDGPQFGFVASSRLGNAVRRNRAKRLMREAVKRVAGALSEKDLWLVLVARSALLESNYLSLEQEIRHKLMNEGIITGDPSR